MQSTRGHVRWSTVDARLRSLREIWIATASPSGRPDAAHVVAHNGDGSHPIIIKGIAERVTDPPELERIDRAYAEKYVARTTGERATIFVADDHVHRVRPRLVSAWSYATVSTRTDWFPGQ